MRLDQYLAKSYPEYSRSVWQKYIELGYVTVDGAVETSTKRAVDDTSNITLSIPEKTDFSEHTLPVIYEDEHVIVINKPIGVLSHSKGELNDEFTVADFFAGKTSYHSDTNRPGIIHRLDRDTSGVMIGAKDDATARLLMKQFQNRGAKKTYYAVVSGTPEPRSAVIDLPIARSPKHPSTFRVDANGKFALTAYEVVAAGEKFSLIKLRPTTGRTHQLRVHLAYIGAPIVGDRVYGREDTRLLLHAAELEITIPGGKRMTFTADMPDEFNEKVKA